MMHYSLHTIVLYCIPGNFTGAKFCRLLLQQELFFADLFSWFLFSCVSLDKVIDHALYITYASQSLLCEESLRNIDLVAKLCVSVSLTGVVFRFEQPVYNILESGLSQEVCVMLVMGSLNRQVIVNVETGTTGTATGRNQFLHDFLYSWRWNLHGQRTLY